MKKWLSTLFSVIFVFTVAAQKFDRQMRLQTCNIVIDVNAFTAKTFVEMEFCNDSDTELEGLYRFTLKPHQVVTAFQLDLNGKYRDGSIEEKGKANNTYNSIVGKRIDPAILQMEYTGNYTLRIYPVPAKGCRKITFTILEKLQNRDAVIPYTLPFNNTNNINNFTVNIKSSINPLPIKVGVLKGEKFVENNLYYNHKLSSRTDSIYFELPLTKQTLCTQQKDSTIYFALRYVPKAIETHTFIPKKINVVWDVSLSAALESKAVYINFLKKYIETHKVETINVTTFNYKIKQHITFTSTQIADLEKFLRNLHYAGATKLDAIDLSKNDADVYLLFTDGYTTWGSELPKTDRTPIFTIVPSTGSYNQYNLTKIIGLTGGAIIPIHKDNIDESAQIASSVKKHLLHITADNGDIILDEPIDSLSVHKTLCSGTITPTTNAILLHYGNNISNTTIRIPVTNQCITTNIDRIKMLTTYESFLIPNNYSRSYNYHWERLLLFGREEKVITTNTAYLVLERVEDYIKYQITPPKELEHLVKVNPTYVHIPKENPIKVSKEQNELTQLQNIAVFYNHRMHEWNMQTVKVSNEVIINTHPTDKKVVHTQTNNTENVNAGTTFYEPTLVNESPKQEDAVIVTGYQAVKKRDMTASVSIIRSDNILANSNSVGNALAGRIAGVQVISNGNPNVSPSIIIRGVSNLTNNVQPLYILDGTPITDINFINPNDLENVTVLKGAYASALYGSRAANGAIVCTTKKGKYYYRNTFDIYKLKDMEDVDYLLEIKDTEKKYRYAKYIELKKRYGFDATFYFDMAEIFYKQNDTTLAKEILSNAAEINSSNATTMQAIAFYYDQWQMYNEAQQIYTSLLKNNPSQIQYGRNLAISYQLQGDYQKAVDTYYEAITNDLNAPMQKALLLNEMNAIIAAKEGRLRVEKMNPSVIKALPVDARVTIENNLGYNNSITIITKNDILGKHITNYGYKYYCSNNMPVQEFMYNDIKQKKFSINVAQHNTNSGPNIYRIIHYKNFGKPNQAIYVENVMMNNQYGNVTIYEGHF